MNFHVIIAEERRVSTPENPRKLATLINADLVENIGINADGTPKLKVTPRPPQLHDMGDRIDSVNNPNLLYIAEWDLVNPYVILHKGKIADIKMAYAGWPMIDKAEWENQNAPA